MIVKVNGKDVTLKNSKTIADFVIEYGIKSKMCAIEKNFEIINRANYPTTLLQDGDSIEIVTLCQGG